MHIRELNLGDAAALRSLRTLVDAEGTLGPASERLRALTPEAIEEQLRPSYETLGAFINDQLVGSAALCPMPDDPFDIILEPNDESWYALVAVLVHPDFRNRGLGKELVERCLDRIRKHQATGALLVVNVPNPAAKGLYETLGFEAFNVEDGVYQHNGQRIDKVSMRMRFSSSTTEDKTPREAADHGFVSTQRGEDL